MYYNQQSEINTKNTYLTNIYQEKKTMVCLIKIQVIHNIQKN